VPQPAEGPARPPFARVLPDEGEAVLLGTLPTVFKSLAEWTDGAYSIVEQPIAPGLLVTPHLHTREDQIAYVIEGTLGFKIGDEELEAPAGSFVFRARGIPHSNWNSTDQPARMLEITSPGHFEEYFRRFGALTASGQGDRDSIEVLMGEYGISFVDEWVPYLSDKYGVKPPGQAKR
jgi:mannose-6-phosphate isomerase-like protein (cupin superfamily)